MKKNSKKASNLKPQAASQISKAVQILKKSGIIIYPTETVYGLGADIFNKKAVEKIFEIKGREKTKALSMAVLKEYIGNYAEINEITQKLIGEHLPGPLTLVLKKKETVPAWLTQTEYIGIRVPENKTVQEIIRKFGPITSTSANISGQKDPVSVNEIAKRIAQSAELIIDEGETTYKGPSTVIKVNEKIEVLRRGVLDMWTKEGYH